jgi:hypothetical protein
MHFYHNEHTHKKKQLRNSLAAVEADRRALSFLLLSSSAEKEGQSQRLQLQSPPHSGGGNQQEEEITSSQAFPFPSPVPPECEAAMRAVFCQLDQQHSSNGCVPVCELLGALAADAGVERAVGRWLGASFVFFWKWYVNCVYVLV